MAASRRMLPVVSLNYIATLYASFNQVIAINEKSVDQRVIKMELIKILQTDIKAYFFSFFLSLQRSHLKTKRDFRDEKLNFLLIKFLIHVYFCMSLFR